MIDLRSRFEVCQFWELSKEEVQAKSSHIEVVITNTIRGLNEEDFLLFPHLKMIACFGPHASAIDVKIAYERGVIVACTPDSTAESVADLAMGFLLALRRRLLQADTFVRSGKWPTQSFPVGREVHHKKIGIIGFGRIAEEIAKRAEGFDLEIAYTGPRKKEIPYEYIADLNVLAQQSDCLIVACPLRPETVHLVNQEVLEALGPEGYLIQISRGPIVDEEALITALQNKKIAGAALDVFLNEPHVNPKFFILDNVLLAPHIGTTTFEMREERRAKLMANIDAFFGKKTVPYLVERFS
jgi:lactate dehydrogenase-like 2-hydroxyacid dehydrogenase